MRVAGITNRCGVDVRWRGRAQGVTWQRVVLEVIEVDPWKSKRPGWVWAESMVARLPPTIREAGTPRWAHVEHPARGAGPNRSQMRHIDQVSDAQLGTSIARYSEVSLAGVHRRPGGAVFGLAKRVLNNASEAEDVTQEVFLRLWNQPDRFDPGRGTLRSFLLTQSHGRAVDAVRSL